MTDRLKFTPGSQGGLRGQCFSHMMEPRFSNLIHSGRLFKKQFVQKPNQTVTNHTGINKKGLSGQEPKFCSTTKTFFPWTSWLRTELCEMENIWELRFDYISVSEFSKEKLRNIPEWNLYTGPHISNEIEETSRWMG